MVADARGDRPKSAWIPKGRKFWEQQRGIALSSADVQRMYESGQAGCWRDEEADQRLDSAIRQAGGVVNGERVCHEFGLADTFAGELVLPYLHAESLYPGSFPGTGQECGDCVSHCLRNLLKILLCCEVVAQNPDEVSGIIEIAPEIHTIGIKTGAFASVVPYWFRGYNGDGWNIVDAVEVALRHAALWPCNNYPELNMDLREYSAALAHRFGRTPPPAEMTKPGLEHLVRTATRPTTFEAIRDLLGNGHGVGSDGDEGFSGERDENGLMGRRGTWSHSMGIAGADDRDIVKKIYGEPLLLLPQSWGIWGSGSRRIVGTNIDIPPGFFWARWSDVRRRVFVAVAGAMGWRPKKLPPLQLVFG